MLKTIIQLSILPVFLLSCKLVTAQPGVTEAVIRDGRSNLLEVRLSEAVSVSDAQGFRLVGGAARIQRLIGGSGSATLLFALTDHVLPDDQFTLLYWPQLGDAQAASGRLAETDDIQVQNQASRYQGKGTLYHVSTAGNDGFKGTTPQAPFRSIQKAFSVAVPGDYILLKRGDVFSDTFVEVPKSGQATAYLTIASYGQGAKPILSHNSKDIFTVADKSYLIIDNLHLQVRGNGETGVYLSGNSQSVVVSNCRIQGIGRPHFGVNFGRNDGASKKVVNPMIINNHISGFRWNIRSSGYPYNGTHEVVGGLIENNISGGNYQQGNDGISAQRGKYHGLVIRKNEVFGWYDDGMDFFAAEDVIIEYNTLHSPQQPASSGQAIKAGGLTRSEPVSGHSSRNIIVRYNTVYNLYNTVNSEGSHNGIQTNDGASGKIYGNVVYNTRGHGIVVSGAIDEWQVYNNTVVNAGNAGLRVWTNGSKDFNVAIWNNILQGKNGDIVVTTNTTKKTIIGEDNILLNNKTSGNYERKGDRSANLKDIFVDPANRDYRLRKN